MELGLTTGMDLSPISLFDGNRRGAEYHCWAAAPEREVTKLSNQARSANRTIDAIDRLDMVEKYIKFPSEAWDSFTFLRKISNWRLDAAALNGFPDCEPTQEELRYVLGMAIYTPGRVKAISSALKDAFGLVCSKARIRGWVVTQAQMLIDATQAVLADANVLRARQPAATTTTAAVGEQATPTAAAQASSSAPASASAAGEAAARAAPVTATESRSFMMDGHRSDPNTYVYKYLMYLYGLKYSQATYEQETAFNTLCQGSSSEEVFANELQRQAAALRHMPGLNQRSIIMRFINGLSDASLAAELMQWLQNADKEVTMEDVMQRVVQYKTTIKELTMLRLQAEAAKTMAQQSMGFDRSALFAKAPGERSSSSSVLAPKKQMLEAAKACVQSGQYPPDHDLAPCLLRGHSSHLNNECRSAQHPRNQPAAGKGQPAAAAVQSADRVANQSHADYAAGAVVPQADVGKGLGARSQQWCNKDDSQGRGSGYRPRDSYRGDANNVLRCELCHGRNHTRERCFYEHPDKAPPHWKPSDEVRAAAYNTYLQKKKQTAPKPAAAAVDAPPKLNWADMVEAEEREQQAAAAALSSQHMPWYLAGGVLLADSIEPAAAAASNAQPHGFWPDALPPRQQAAAASKSSSSAGRVYLQLSSLPDNVCVQVKLRLSYDKLLRWQKAAGVVMVASGRQGSLCTLGPSSSQTHQGAEHLGRCV